MNLTKHFISTKKNHHIATFVSKINEEGLPLFGWSRYNYHKEKSCGFPFSKKEGIKEALKSTNQKIIINTHLGSIHKENVVVYDSEMVYAAVNFVLHIKRYYKKTPVNVKLILCLNFLDKLTKEIFEENKKLKEENYKLLKIKLHLSIIEDIKRKIEEITNV